MGFPQIQEPLLQLPTRGTGPISLLLFFFLFSLLSYPVMHGSFLSKKDPLGQHVFSRSLWRLFHLSMYPWYYCEKRWTPCPPILLSWLSSPYSFDKCTMPFIHHHSIIHHSCTALKVSCPSLLGPLPTSYQIAATTVLFTVSLVLSLPEWHIIGITWCGVFSDWLGCYFSF